MKSEHVKFIPGNGICPGIAQKIIDKWNKSEHGTAKYYLKNFEIQEVEV